MKLTRKILRKMILREMSFKDNIFLDDLGDRAQTKQTKRVKKFTTSNSFTKKLKKYFSEKMGFPGSDVWIRHVAQFIELGQFDPYAKVIKPQTRAAFYEPTDKLLRLLKIDPHEFDKTKDVAILSRSDVLSRGFLPSPHMIIHAAAHGDSWQFYPEDETVLIKCAEFCYLVSNLLENQEIPPNAFSTQTKSLRQGDYGDNAIELITAYFLNYRAAQINIPGRQELSLKLDQMAKEAANELKELFKGKIAVVTTVNEIDA